jgi:hypothetical protein
LQRCPRNSVEQLGQTDDASFLRLAGAAIAGTSAAAFVVEFRVERDIEPGGELMPVL